MPAMVGASKILTVSYGTFSCTLEGFEDPFDTMKAIAEYFRDLAAEDRYFGAEPPQPDAAMLHKIAEREVQRRVEAKVQDNGVILRAEAQAQPAMPPMVRMPSPPREAMIAEAEEPAATPTVAPQSDVLAGSVADKLRRLRAASRPAGTVEAAVAPPVMPAVIASPAMQDVAAPEASVAPDTDLRASETADVQEAVLSAPMAEEPVAEAAVVDPALAEDAPVVEAAVGEADAGEASVGEASFEAPLDEAAPVDMAPVDMPAADTTAVDEAGDQGGAHDALTPSDSGEELPAAMAVTPAADPDRAAAIAAAFADDEDLAEALQDADETVLSGTEAEVVMPEAAPEADTAFAALADVAEASAADAARLDDAADDDAMIAALTDSLHDTLPETPMAPEGDEDDAFLAALTRDMAQDRAVAEGQTDDALIAALVDAPVEAEGQTDDALIAALVDAPVEAEAVAEGQSDEALIAALVDAPVEAEAVTEGQTDDALIADMVDAPVEAEVVAEGQSNDAPMAAVAGDLSAVEALDDTSGNDTQEAAVTEAAPDTDTETAPGPVPGATTAVADKLQRARARVIKIRRIETPAAAPALSPEAEAELARELAALRGDAVDPATAPLPATQRRDGGPARPALPEAPEEPSVKRLLDAANSHMEEPESRRRLSAIAHLKAAVAATVADRKAGTGPDEQAEETRLTAYRSDLEQVVRPRRPVSSSGTGAGSAPSASPQGATARPAPLVLVSAQRIDRPAAADPTPAARPTGPVQPVRPRRVGGLGLAQTPADAVSASETPVIQSRTMESAMVEDDDLDAFDEAEDTDNVFASSAGFADFAERLGATDLVDLLEAAAAYATCVEGRPSVTRPQLIRRVHDVMGDAEPSREDMLRGFGRLLRDGRIEKVRRGQFAVREDSRVMAEARRIAG